MFQLAKRVAKAKIAKESAQRSIATNHANVNSSIKQQKRKSMFDVYNTHDGNLGIVRMNKEHRYNMLTPGFINELRRGVETHNIDNDRDVIYMAPRQGEHFSIGTDFRMISHMKKEENYDKIAEYFEQLYSLQTYFAKLNKPLVVAAPGVALNSGAALLSACSYPLATETLKFGFNDVNYGFVPHSGASFYMSRMPGEFGTFMAVTGLSIGGADTSLIGGVTNGMIEKTKYYDEHVASIVDAMELQASGVHDHNPDYRGRDKPLTPWQAYLEQKNHLEDRPMSSEGWKMLQRSGNQMYREEFLEPKDRSISSVAEAEYNYMQMLKTDANKDVDTIGYFDWGKNITSPDQRFLYKNHFAEVHGFLKENLGQNFDQNATEAVKNRQLIDRCFFSNSIEEIRENLRKESHPFAKKCLDAMDKNSPLSMQLALKMVRKAQNLDYRGCLRMELDVAMNKVKDKDFDIGVSNVLGKRQADRFTQSPFNQNVQEWEVDKYFEPSNHSKNIQIDVVEHALLPTKMYFDKFSDQVRLWINEESTTQSYIREGFDEQAKEALREQGIDVRDKALTIENARNHLAGKLAKKRREEVGLERMNQLMTDKKLRSNYVQQVETLLGQMEGNQKEFDDKVQMYVNQIFEDAYIGRLDTFYKKSQEAQGLKKRQMFNRLKKFMFKSRILTYANQSQDKLMKELNNMTFKQPHLTEKWDKSYRDMDHPNIKKSPLHYISKAIGRVNLAPAELAQSYLTQPEMRQKLSMVTFDEAELKRLQADILAEPDKYIEAFTAREPSELDIKQNQRWDRDIPGYKQEDKAHWYRVLNDGRCPIDAFPWIQEYEAYKDWAENIEDKALDSLKLAVNQLLMEIQASKSDANKTYSSCDSDTTETSLKRLIDLTNTSRGASKPKARKTRAKRVRNKKFRADNKPGQLTTLLSEVLGEDDALVNIFDKEKFKGNRRVEIIREQAEKEFAQLVELVVLDKYGPAKPGSVEHSRQQKLYLDLANASGTPKDIERNLNLQFVDTYLANENGKAMIADAVEVLKPFFLEMMAQKVHEEQTRVLNEEFGAEKNLDHEVAFHYFFTKKYPNSHDTAISQHIREFSRSKESFKLAEQQLPGMSLDHQRRNILSMLDKELDPQDLDTPLGKSEAEKSMEQTRVNLERLSEFDAEASKIQAQFDRENQGLKDDFRSHMQMDSPIMDLKRVDPAVAHDTEMWERRTHEIETVLENLKYELENVMSKGDWLAIYADSIIDENLNMNYVRQFHKLEVEKRIQRNEKITNPLYGQKDLEVTRTNEEWQSLAEYSRYLSQFGEAIGHTKKEDQEVDLQKFLAKFNQRTEKKSSLASQSIFLNSIKKANEQAEKPSYDRSKDIKESLRTLKGLQEAKDQREKLSAEIQRLMENNNIKNELIEQELSKNGSKYLDLENLKQQLVTRGQDWQPSSSYNTQALIDDLSKNTTSFDEVMQTKIDVASLQSLRNQKKQNDHFKLVLDHIDEQTQYMSDSVRKQTSLGEFLNKHHFSSTQTYQEISDAALKQRLQQHFGQSQDRASVPDWQFANARTHPADHYNVNKEQTENMLDRASIQDLYEKDEDNVSAVANTDLRNVEVDTQSNLDQRVVLTDAKKMTELPYEMESLQNMFQNNLIKLQSQEEFKQDEISSLIEEYSQLRLNACLLNPEFQNRIKGENRQVFFTQLKENVMDELNVTSPALMYNLSSFSQNNMKNTERQYDIDAAYNLQDLNNADALGYKNLIERSQAGSAQENANLAQDSALDKLMADYFLGKRAEYKESNKMFKDLSKIFQDKKKPYETRSLDLQRLKQQIDKEDEPMLDPSDFRNLMELDNAAARAIQKNKCGLSNELRKLNIKDTEEPDHYLTQIPEYFEHSDVRKPADVLVNDVLKEIIQECFNYRNKLEKDMSRRELLAFDKTLEKYLTHENLSKKLRYEVKRLFNELDQGNSIIEHAKAREADMLNAESKRNPELMMSQRDYNKNMKNEDAQFKLMAYDSLRELKAENFEEFEKEDLEMKFNYENSFEEFYRKELETDIRRQPKTINAADFKPKKSWEKVPQDAEYRNEEERKADFFGEHKAYLENKLEQQERMQLFYILEQFHQTATEKPNPASDAQKHINEYFSVPENTFFFDKNKIK